MDLLELEQQRQALEDNLERLRQSLKHWQTWEAEYEGLKEELQSTTGDSTNISLAHIAKTYDGELVNEKEVRELSGLDKGSPRSAQQIVGLIERRQDYVQKNIETTQRQFFETEAKAEELAFAAANYGRPSNPGLPLTEIHEELDEDGNVISSHLSQPEESTAKVFESLKKAGMGDDMGQTPQSKPKPEDLKPAITNVSPPITPTVAFTKRGESDSTLTKSKTDESDENERPSIRKKSVSFTADTKPPPAAARPESQDGRKSVSFAEKVAVMPAAPPPDNRSVSFSPMVEEIPPQPLGPGSPVVPTTAGDDRATKVTPVPGTDSNHTCEIEDTAIIMPEDESPEDAQTRREMLEYHLNEVGNVVAQIDLDEAAMDDDEDDEDSSSYFTTSEYQEGDEDTPYTTGLSGSEDEDESEDEFGRSKRRQVSVEHHKRMMELEKRLIGNLGPDTKDEEVEAADPELDPKDVRRLVIREKRTSTSSADSESSEKKVAGGAKKRVSFAQALDVAEPGSPPLKAVKVKEGEYVAPVSAEVTERTTAAMPSLPSQAAVGGAKVSRFKKDRAQPPASAGAAATEDRDTEPNPPLGVTLADTLTERKPSRSPAIAPSADEPDQLMQRRELATEYYRRRNEMIQQQGGFRATPDEDDEMGELMEEREDGSVRKVSRFKAARIRS